MSLRGGREAKGGCAEEGQQQHEERQTSSHSFLLEIAVVMIGCSCTEAQEGNVSSLVLADCTRVFQREECNSNHTKIRDKAAGRSVRTRSRNA